MEHRLVLGGEQFLPFARSRIKALRDTGLPYADQSFEIDGVSIKVRIEPGHEYIRLEGGSTLEMDSGVVDLGNIGYENPARFLPGQLYGTDYYKSYTLGFTVVKGDWKTNPSDTKQVAGKLTYAPGIKGAIHPDAFNAISFTPKTGEAADEALYLKKLVTTACPASMFTGKCRLYVQAMYGRPLHLGGISNGLMLGSGAGQRPWLKIDSFDKFDDQPVVIGITTDSGVYLDKLTGKHYLVNLTNYNGTAYPLQASAPVEKLRKRLVSFYNGTSGATEEDTEHLEAYILSDCKPVHGQRQSFSFNATKPVWSLGYGWHWNWSGTKADFVCNEQFEQTYIPGTGDNVALRSTHYRLSLAFADNKFTAESSIVRGPDDWTLVPSQWCILEPDWSTGSASKLQPPYTRMMEGAATFYAYYARDELKTCTVDITATESPDDFIEYSNGWVGDPMSGDRYRAFTYGMDDGFYTARSSLYGVYYTAVFNCAGVSSGELVYNRVYTESNDLIVNKVKGEAPPGLQYDNGTLWYSATVTYGHAPYSYKYFPACVVDRAFPPPVEFDYKTRNTQVVYYSYAHILIPFCDAEAVAVRTEAHKYTTYSNAFTTKYTVSAFSINHSVKVFVPGYTVGAPNVDWVWVGAREVLVQDDWYSIQDGAPGIGPMEPEDLENTDDTLASVATLTAKTQVEMTMDDRNEYGNIMFDSVPVHYEVRSGVREGDTNVIIAPAVEAQKGVDHTFSNPTIVGWV